MLPSLVAEDLRRVLTDFLGTTFALGDDDVRAELERFVADPAQGVFRGPYVRLRLPFRPAGEGWRDVLDWVPDGFVPHRHQAAAWARLSSRDGEPRPTMVTTGTGSGKTESFLVPLLDHCRRHAGEPGIKALVLYPMNALASDQARRVAALVARHVGDLGDVRVGLYTGDKGGVATMTADSVITERRALQDHPPDILLTNYKMLDFLLLRPEDARLWSSSRESLRYLVLDEFHTYDGAQGTDVAMLLRRLGTTLGIARPGRPLGDVCPVGTSATLGGGEDGGAALRRFAERVFGRSFEDGPEDGPAAAAIVGEERLTPDEWMRPGEIATVRALAEITETLNRARERAGDGPVHGALLRAAAALWRRGDEPEEAAAAVVDDPVALGERLRAHPLTRRLLDSAATPCPLDELVRDAVPEWDTATEQGRTDAREALGVFLALLSHARSADDRPLLGVDVQLWAREVSRLERRLSAAAGFRWHHAGPQSFEDDRYLPAVYCRHCGRSGWGVARPPAGDELEGDPDQVWRGALRRPERFRALLFAPGEAMRGDTTIRRIDPDTLQFVSGEVGRHSSVVPVLATAGDAEALAERCPSCGRDDGIRFLGSRVTTLASAALGQLFASADVAPAEKKTLMFTDSVQDASHRAAFVESRVFVLNLRALLHRALPDGGTTLDGMGVRLVDAAGGPPERFALVPPELRDHARFRPFWQGGETDADRAVVTTRLGFAAHLEFSLAPPEGRTLELTGAVTAHVDVADAALIAAATRAVERVQADSHQPTLDDAPPARLLTWARGVVERLRTRGGVHHPWWERFVEAGGDDRRWSIWGGRPRDHGMPAFPSATRTRPGRPAPAFLTTARTSDEFDALGSPRGRYATWSAQVLGVASVDAPRYVRALADELARAGALSTRATTTGATVYGIPAERVRLERTDRDDEAPQLLRCDVCATRVPGPEVVRRALDGAPCQRDRCVGRLVRRTLAQDYYRTSYRSGAVRRIVAREHTSLLDAEERELLEAAFGAPADTSRPAVPNVVACTPTLELGIDIGDLSMVTLSSLPRTTAAYLQRVGRAGRATGNALVVALLPGRPLELQRLTDPLSMIAGEVVPPDCYLDATELLHRQYVASLVDRWARSSPAARVHEARDVLAAGLGAGSWLTRLVDDAETHAAAYVDDFLLGYGEHVHADTAAGLRLWAAPGAAGSSGLREAVVDAVARWHDQRDELDVRISMIDAEIEKLEAVELLRLGDAEQRQAIDLRRLRGEQRVARAQRTGLEKDYWLSALEGLGLLPNYALRDDATRLDVNLWWTDEDSGRAEQTDDRYVRGSRTALRELAPGATFYAKGAAVTIDGLDLGTANNPAIERRRYCPECGWSIRVLPGDPPLSCGRCGSAGAADVGQVLTVLPFRGASAYAERDRSRSADTDEERRRAAFSVITTVDVDPDDIAAAWRLEDYPFGVEVARAALVRWTNLGLADRGGSTRTLGGDEAPAPLFHACSSCGVVPAAQAGVQGDPDTRHRGWCRQRREPDPQGWSDVALTHELTTQATRLLVPPIVTADDTLLASFRAALLVGLREVIGGDPDHLDVVVTSTPDVGGARRLMVLHDLVPGGTGYLARFAEPDRVRELLTAAHDRLASCLCATEPVAACHRCLLPYVAPADAAVVRRDRAVALLREILDAWSGFSRIDSLREIAVGPHETPIERRLRQALVDAATAVVDGGADRVRLTLDGAIWLLEPQVPLGGVQPDFVLTRADGPAPPVAVFCDGAAWHSSAAANRIADDAAKRAALRAQGYVVWAVTHADLDTAAGLTGAPSWVSAAVASEHARLAPRLVPPGAVAPTTVRAPAVSGLLAFLGDPRRDAWRPPVLALAVAAAGALPDRLPCTEGEAVAGQTAAAALGERVPAPAGPVPYAVTDTPGGAALGLAFRAPDDVGAHVVVDDRADLVGTDDQQQAWRDWLAASNVLQFLDTFDAAAASSGPTVVPAGPPVADPAWSEVADVVVPELADVVAELAARGTPPGVPGHEEAGLDTELDLAWPERRLALVVGDDPERDRWLDTHGWVRLPIDVRSIVDALSSGGRP